MIAIKDMEMPKECYRCPLLDGEYGTCNIIGETKVDMTEERARDCPLVEIVTCKDCKYQYKDCEGNGICYINGLRRSNDFYCKDAERR